MYDSNQDLPKMLSKTGLKNMISGRRKQITRRLAPSLESDEHLKAPP